ncbi:MAG TPA: CBS domain-containing protein [Methanoregulaceae archaeon]|nr:CBS domain-containing protein [Methanoregulaceae archaeon]MDD3091117.1 CBS domain-containing protein [Methanoregulaceae archaeon]MDD5049459.1 CBS domain-containing protein [Methanoregulaceae archaeon]MDD5685985.1 CBS domain-containing protein [Methanoregulaceae archaeon]HOP66755.1 CBS domain-containing protein [Methanoregulaceae archaeon]
MNGSLKIGSLYGIPILIHWTLLLIIPIFAWIIGSQIELTSDLLSSVYRVKIDQTLITAGYMEFILGVVVALGLFAGVLVHEMAHSIVAQKKGIKINSITLLIFGGISSMEEGMPDPVVELPMALVGPLTSLAVGLASSVFVYISHLLISSPPLAGVLVFVFGYLGILNIFLFAFNLLPAFPMDGGRVLRAFLAKRMPLHKATRIAADVGRIFAVIFGIFGIFLFNPILILIAFFIYIGASQESTVVKYSFLLKDVTVGDMMSTDVMTVGPGEPVREVIDQMYASKHLGFPVVQNDVLVGIVTLADVHKVPPIDREAMIVKDIMSREVITLPPSAPVIEALRIMSVNNIGRIPVVDQDRLAGIVTRTDILKVIELKEI